MATKTTTLALGSLAVMGLLTFATPTIAMAGDADVIRDVQRALEPVSDRIIVRAHDGTVYLTGTVNTPVARREAVRRAESAPGVTNVIESLESITGENS